MATSVNFDEAKKWRANAKRRFTVASNHLAHGIGLKLDDRLPTLMTQLEDAMIDYLDSVLAFNDAAKKEQKTGDDLKVNSLTPTEHSEGVNKVYADSKKA